MMDSLAEKALEFLSEQARQESLAEHKIFHLGTFGKYTVDCPDYSEAILNKDPRCFIDRWLNLGGHCYISSRYNAAHAWKDLELHLVCGSLGFGGWFEHGSPSYVSARDFAQGKPIGWDWHVWLEDSEGLVYDVVSSQWHGIAAIHGKDLKIPRGPIQGMNKTALRASGLEYLPASAETRTILLDAAARVYAKYAAVLGL